MNPRPWADWIVNNRYSQNLPAIAFGLILLPAVTMQAVGVAGSHAATIDITDYGANGGDEVDDTAAIQAAIAALNANDVLLIPQSSLYFKVAINANFTIDKPGIRVIVRGRVLATGTPLFENYLFNVSYADNCEFIGEGGILEGSGEYLTTGNETYCPSLIRFIVCNGGSVRNLRLRNGPSICISMVGGSGIRITNCTLEGGLETYEYRLHAIFFIGITDLLIKGNRFMPSDAGGKMGQWISSSSTCSNTFVSIVNNQFGSSHDHAVYTSGLFNSVIANNTVRDSGGSSIKTIGTNNVIANNNIYGASGGGIEARNASRCVIANNLIDQFGYTGIEVSLYGGSFSGDYTDILIHGNSLRAKDSGTIYEGVRILVPTKCSRCKVTGNILLRAGGSGGTPAITINSGEPSYSVSISKNTLEECAGDGISINNINRSIISDNIVQVSAGKTPILQQNVTVENLVTDNLLTIGGE